MAVTPAESKPADVSGHQASASEATLSALSNWPIQLRLVPPHAPFLQGADLLLAADCVPFALADFHPRFLAGRVLLVGCPKLDDVSSYEHKLAQIFAIAQPRSLTILHMEVPCCTGLVRLAESASQLAGASPPIQQVVISLRGEVLESKSIG